MKFYRYLYLSESYKKKKTLIKYKLRWNIGQVRVYLIVISKGSSLLEIYHAGLLKQKAFPRKGLFVVGIAKGYGEAIRITQDIIQEVYDNTHDVDVKSYLFQKQNNSRSN